MRRFVCDHCRGVLFFENDTCLKCGRQVGFRPDTLSMCTSEAAAAAGFAPCRNWSEHTACNWYAPAGDATAYCASCALNEVVPDLADSRRRELWAGTERAKRRLIFTLLELGLPLLGLGGREALRFRLLADERADTGAIDPPEEPIYTGHDDGRLTVNVVEADDALREAVRKRLNEPYRTMLGHLRHEIGHYYWYLLVGDTPQIAAFRERFGDERTDYGAALQRHYDAGPADGWSQGYVSAYASVHPWEDFAETWAHFIHIVDTLETANACGLGIEGRRLAAPLPLGQRPFAAALEDWLALSVGLNQLNRSMGMRDAYPFALTPAVVGKLEFVHDVCRRAIGTDEGPPAAAGPTDSRLGNVAE